MIETLKELDLSGNNPMKEKMDEDMCANLATLLEESCLTKMSIEDADIYLFMNNGVIKVGFADLFDNNETILVERPFERQIDIEISCAIRYFCGCQECNPELWTSF